MRTALLFLALAAPALVTGCKKKEPEPAPVAAQPPAPKPAFDAAWGPATFVGSRAEGNTGELKVPFTLTNDTGSAVVVQAVAVHVFSGEEKVCGAKVSLDNGKADVGAKVSGEIEIPCDYHTIPAGENLNVKTTIVYEAAGEAKEARQPASIPFSR